MKGCVRVHCPNKIHINKYNQLNAVPYRDWWSFAVALTKPDKIFFKVHSFLVKHSKSSFNFYLCLLLNTRYANFNTILARLYFWELSLFFYLLCITAKVGFDLFFLLRLRFHRTNWSWSSSSSQISFNWIF